MWYLITFEDCAFTKIIIEENDITRKFERFENGIPVFNLKNGKKNYILEVLDNTPDLDSILTDLEKLANGYFILINHSTVLIKWSNIETELINGVKEAVGSKNKFVIFPISKITTSNFLNVNFTNDYLSK